MAKATSAERRILIVDDEGIHLTLPRVLRKYGFDLRSVVTLEDALVQLQAVDT